MAIETISQMTLTDVLRQDHRRLKALFSDFENAAGRPRERITSEALTILAAHDLIEQTLLYPMVAKETSISRELVLRCEEAHHVVHLLMAELKLRPYSERYFAKFAKLAAGVREHIEEEESELFPALERSSIDNAGLGRRVQRVKSGADKVIGGMRSMSRGRTLAAAAVLAGAGWAIYRAFSKKD